MFVRPKLILRATEEFLFEYDNQGDANSLEVGDKFSYDGHEYEILRLYEGVQAIGSYSFFVIVNELT